MQTNQYVGIDLTKTTINQTFPSRPIDPSYNPFVTPLPAIFHKICQAEA